MRASLHEPFPSAESHATVGKREKRHDNLRRVRGDVVHEVVDVVRRLLLAVERHVRRLHRLVDRLAVLGRDGICGHRGGNGHSGDIRVHSTLKKAEPDGEQPKAVGQERGHASTGRLILLSLEDEGGCECAGGNHERSLDMGGEEHCDDGDRAEVVDRRERKEECAERGREPALKEAEHTHGKGDICGHWHSPSGVDGGGSRLCLHGKVNAHGNNHASECRDARQERRFDVSQRAVHQLTLDFKSNDEEEDRHESFVDPQLKAERVPVVKCRADGRCPQVGPRRRGGWDVREEQTESCAGEQKHAATTGVDEVRERSDETHRLYGKLLLLYRFLRFAKPFRCFRFRFRLGLGLLRLDGRRLRLCARFSSRRLGLGHVRHDGRRLRLLLSQ
mmetsp:Transcript_6150/g.13967  ORF Transcript_6150/g.13967 Transcript_6150/m.13967 type:complete len:390 (+) Transcript_6150:527-1696(+)